MLKEKDSYIRGKQDEKRRTEDNVINLMDVNFVKSIKKVTCESHN